MVLTDRQKNDLDLAILEYLSGESSKYAETLSAFKGETGLSDSQIATGKNVLEKKWVSIVRLQKKITELEGTVASLTSQLKTLCGADALINSAGNTPCKENDATKIFPVGPAKGSLLGHRGPVTSVAVHPFYTLIASASEDASIMLWDSETMTYDRAMKGHTGAITSIQFDNTGNTLGSSSVDMTIKLWSTKDFACMKTLRGHDHAISCLQFLHCNEHIASCSRDGSVKYWQISTGYCLHTFTSGSIETWFKTISVSLDNNYIASAGTDRIISVWSLKSKVLVSTLRGHDHVIETLCYGKKPFQVQANDRVETLTDSSSSSTSISDTSDETAFSYLLSGSRDKTIRLWDPLRQTELQKISCHENWVRTVLFTANYKYVISVSDDKSIRVTEIKNSTVYRTILNAHQHFITNACLTYRNSPILITSSIDKSICIWSLQ